MPVVGLVGEGWNDHVVLQGVIGEIARQRGAAVTFKSVQPTPDATSGGSPHGGWSHVMQWCRRNGPTDRRWLLFEQLFAGVDPIDMLVVQLDADQLNDLSHHCNVALPAAPSAVAKGQFVNAVLEEWLWPAGTKVKANHPDKFSHAIAVWAIETWLVSHTNHHIPNIEETDPVPLVIAIQPALEDPRRPGRLKKKKVQRHYMTLTADLIQNIHVARGRCFHLNRFCDDIEPRM